MYQVIIFIGLSLLLFSPIFAQQTEIKTIEVNGKKISITVPKRDTIYPYNIPLINLQGDTILSKKSIA